MVQVFFPPASLGRVYRVNGVQYPLSFAGANSAMVDASNLGGGTVVVEGGHGSILGLGTDLLPKNNVTLIQEKGTKLLNPVSPSTGAIMSFVGSTTSGTVLASGVSRGTRTCTLAAGGVAANAIVAGSLCEIVHIVAGNELWTQVNRVKSVSGEVIQWENPLRYAFTTSGKVRRWSTYLENFKYICEDDDSLVGPDSTAVTETTPSGFVANDGYFGVHIIRHYNCEWQVRSRDFHGPTSQDYFACALRSQYGFESTYYDCYDQNSGDGGYSDFSFNGDSDCTYERMVTSDPFGFGQSWDNCSGMIINSPRCSGASGRGLKIDSSRDWVMNTPVSNGNRTSTYGSLTNGVGIMISGANNLNGEINGSVTDGNEYNGLQTAGDGSTSIRINDPEASYNGNLNIQTAAADISITVNNPRTLDVGSTFDFEAAGVYRGIVNDLNTTDGVATQIALFPASGARGYHLTTVIVGHRTGGSSGTANDSAAYSRSAGFKGNGAGTCTQVGATATPMTVEDQAGWDVAVAASGSAIIINVLGAANNNVSWRAVTDLVVI